MIVPMPSVCAVVVAFHPNSDLEKLLGVVLSQARALIVIDNTKPAARRRINLPVMADREVYLIENVENVGVGAALNQGLEHALRLGCEWLLTLDQDSLCHDDLVATLLAAREACNPPPVVIGSNYLDPRNGVLKIKQKAIPEFIDQTTVITSGSLVEVRFAKAIGGFRADYFIDQLDHEFCLRVRAHGGRVVISSKPVMEHSVGEADGVWLPMLGRLPNHAPVRKYYIARNSLVTIAKYWRSEPEWCLRRLLRLLSGFILMATLEPQRWKKVQSFVAGVTDALAGRLGSSERI